MDKGRHYSIDIEEKKKNRLIMNENACTFSPKVKSKANALLLKRSNSSSNLSKYIKEKFYSTRLIECHARFTSKALPNTNSFRHKHKITKSPNLNFSTEKSFH